jgi:hypothetical protein
MQRGNSAVSMLRMTSWPVLILLTLALLLALASYWLRADAVSRVPLEPVPVVQSAPAQSGAVVVQSTMP